MRPLACGCFSHQVEVAGRGSAGGLGAADQEHDDVATGAHPIEEGPQTCAPSRAQVRATTHKRDRHVRSISAEWTRGNQFPGRGWRGDFLAPPRVSCGMGEQRLTFTCGRVPGDWFGYRSYVAPDSSAEDELVVVQDEVTGRVRAVAYGAVLGPADRAESARSPSLLWPRPGAIAGTNGPISRSEQHEDDQPRRRSRRPFAPHVSGSQPSGPHVHNRRGGTEHPPHAMLRRYLPKCGTVNAIRPRSPE